MINLLFVSVTERHINSEIVRKIKENSIIDHLHMIVNDANALSVFEQYGECLLREDVAQGIYRDNIFSHTIPIEDDLLKYMNLHSTEIMNQQQRFEKYHAFCIDADWNSHYTIYMHNLYFWYNYLKDKQITHVFFPATPHEGYDYIIYHLCKYLGIAVLLINVSILQNRRYYFTDIYDIKSVIEQEYSKMLRDYKDADIEDIPLDGETARLFEGWVSLEPDKMKPWYMRVNPFERRLRIRFGETNIIRLWRGVLGPDYVKYGKSLKFIFSGVRKLPQMLGVIPGAVKRMRLAGPVKRESMRLNKFYNSLAEMPHPGEKYIYFPLHYQPEATSNPMGGDMYADQILPINILSHALPKDVKIYVKSHPEQLAPLRSRAYYLDMNKIPNVRLMKLECSTFELIRNAVAVATLTGTALWECQFFGIPALAFGYSLKNLAPLSYAVRTVEDCQAAISEIMSTPKKNALKELKLYTKALHNCSFDVNEIESVVPELINNFVCGKENILK